MIYHVVAVANHRVIGKDNRLPWHFSSDLKYFKTLTLGSTVIMGRKTFESIGRPLPGRTNFVLSRTNKMSFLHVLGGNPRLNLDPGSPTKDFGDDKLKGTEIFYFFSLDEALRKVTTPKAFIVGGAELYRQTINQVDGIYLTQIHADYEGDAFYPEIPARFVEECRKPLQDNPKIEAVFYRKRRTF